MIPLLLIEPILVAGAQVAQLMFRSPTGKDVRQCGVPTKVEVTPNGTQMHHTDTEAVARLISTLANIPPSSVDQLSAVDFLNCVPVIASFFNGTATTSSPDAGSSAASTAPAPTPSS